VVRILISRFRHGGNKFLPGVKMGVRIQQYTGQKFITTMPEAGNQNPHHTLFAGSE
jgi:hypothetical protein